MATFIGRVSSKRCFPRSHTEQRRTFATVTMMGCYSNEQGSRYRLKKKFGIKCPNGLRVKPGRTLVKQRKQRIEYWPGKNVMFSRDRGLVALAEGRMTWSYDPVQERRYVSILGEGEDPNNFVIPKTHQERTTEELETRENLKAAREARLQSLVDYTKSRQAKTHLLLTRPKPNMNILTEIIGELTSQSRTLESPQKTAFLNAGGSSMRVNLID